MTDTGKALVCPYCRGTIMIEMETRGHGHLSYDAPNGFECDACDATWNLLGVPLIMPRKS